jgi:hypothetical protein
MMSHLTRKWSMAIENILGVIFWSSGLLCGMEGSIVSVVGRATAVEEVVLVISSTYISVVDPRNDPCICNSLATLI